MNLILSHQKRQESSSERSLSALDIESIHRVEKYLTKSLNYLSSQRSSLDSKMNLISNQEIFVLLKYSNHLSCSRIFKKYICLLSKLIFLFDLDDDVNIRSTWNFQFSIFLRLIWKRTVQSNRKLSSTSSAMLTSILRVKTARFVDNRSCWFCQCIIRRSIEIHLITRFRYNSDEDIFF